MKSQTPEWKASIKKGLCPLCKKKTGNFPNLQEHFESAHGEDVDE